MVKKQRKIKIGTCRPTYPHVRNFMSLPFEKYEFRKTYDFFTLPNLIYQKIFKQWNQIFLNLYDDLGMNRCTLHHFFNTISTGKTPWISTFETFLPRWGIQTDSFIEYGLKKMASDRCKKLIAISERTYDIQSQYLDKYPSYRDEIMEKICVIHPAQPLLIKDIEEKQTDPDHIVFTIVGGFFFLKGGREILTVFDRLISNDYPVKLNIVSALRYNDHISGSTREDLESAKKIIEKYPHQISHYPSLPNIDVLKLFRQSHVGLLPSYADTYGYSVLEAQAAGCPVITTDVRVFPEINNDGNGWIIEVPKNKWGNGLLDSKDDKKKFSGAISENLDIIIKNIVSGGQDLINEKGRNAIKRIDTHHNPRSIAKQIESIYDKSLSSL